MEKLRGHGLRELGTVQAGPTIVEVLVNGWWVITIQECMTNDDEIAYLIELSENCQQMDLIHVGFMTINAPNDIMLVRDWQQALMFFGWNVDHFKDKVPTRVKPEPLEAEGCGWCGQTVYPHICGGSLTEEAGIVSTANASKPNPPRVTQAHKDELDMASARLECSCGSPSGNWQNHSHTCSYNKEAVRIAKRKVRVIELFPRR